MSLSTQFVPKMIDYMGEICKDNYERSNKVNAAIEDKSIDRTELLSKGIWYGVDYCKALKNFNFQDRLKWMVQTGASHHGLMPKCFTPVKDIQMAAGKKICNFKIAKGYLPSEALDSLDNSFSLLGCGEVIEISIYRSLKDILGKEKFDLLFAWNSKTPLEIGGNQDPSWLVFKKITIKSTASFQPGDFCHFLNIQLYMMKHPFGVARGYNAICSSKIDTEPKFLALGLNPEEVTIPGVEENLLDEFNKTQEENEFISQDIITFSYRNAMLRDEKKSKELVESYKDVTLTKEEFEKAPSRQAFENHPKIRRLLLPIDRPDLAKIQKLIDASLDEVRKIFDQF